MILGYDSEYYVLKEQTEDTFDLIEFYKFPLGIKRRVITKSLGLSKKTWKLEFKVGNGKEDPIL